MDDKYLYEFAWEANNPKGTILKLEGKPADRWTNVIFKAKTASEVDQSWGLIVSKEEISSPPWVSLPPSSL